MVAGKPVVRLEDIAEPNEILWRGAGKVKRRIGAQQVVNLRAWIDVQTVYHFLVDVLVKTFRIAHEAAGDAFRLPKQTLEPLGHGNRSICPPR